MKACLFQNGLLTKVYKDLQTTDNLEYSLGVNRLSGTLYMLADTEQLIDWNNLQPQSVTEEEWLQMTASSENGQPHPFWTGKVSLDSLTSGKQTLSVNMKRGVARFDLLVRGTAISVHRLTLKNVRQQGYLLSRMQFLLRKMLLQTTGFVSLPLLFKKTPWELLMSMNRRILN